MEHPIFQSLNAFGLSNASTLRSKINQMSPQDWDAFVDHLEKAYRKFPTLGHNLTRQIQPLSFSFPPLTGRLLPNITTHALIGERVFLDDPLYDHAVALTGERLVDWNSIRISRKDKYKLSSARESKIGIGVDQILVKEERSQVEEIIRFYLRAKDLISDERLIPYKELGIPPHFFDVVQSFQEMIRSRTKLQKKLGVSSVFWSAADAEFKINDYNQYRQLSRRIRIPLRSQIHTQLSFLSLVPSAVFSRFGSQKMGGEIFHRLDEIYDHVLLDILKSEFMQNEFPRAYSTFVQVQGNLLWQTSSEFHGASTDLLTPENAYLFRLVTESVFKANSQLDPSLQIALPGDINLLGIDIPLLTNIPPERVLELIQNEEQAYQQFRGYLNDKLLSITAPVGSKERSVQIQRIRETIAKNTSDMSMAYDRLQRDYSRRFQVDLLLASSSILVAGLSAVGRNVDAISIASGVAAGAGFIASVKEFAHDWLEHQRELEKLHTNDNYFIWKMTRKSKRLSKFRK